MNLKLKEYLKLKTLMTLFEHLVAEDIKQQLWRKYWSVIR